MRRIFLKVDNAIKGRYFAELTKRVLARHEASKGHESLTEMRLSVYGMERNEWLQNAQWVLRDWKGGDSPGPVLSAKNKWMVQIPRLWRIFRKKHANDKGKSFNHMLENIFAPMIEATLHPEEVSLPLAKSSSLLRSPPSLRSLPSARSIRRLRNSSTTSSVSTPLTTRGTLRRLATVRRPPSGSRTTTRRTHGSSTTFGLTLRSLIASESPRGSIHLRSDPTPGRLET